jgi:hypothetical protein
LFLGFGIEVPKSSPELQVPITDGQNGRGHAPSFEVPKDAGPRFSRLPIAGLQSDDLFPAIGQDADDYQARQTVLFQADVEVDTIGPDVDVLLSRQRALAPGFVLFLPHTQQTGEGCG